MPVSRSCGLAALWPLLGLAPLTLWSSFAMKPLDPYGPESLIAFYLGQGLALGVAAVARSRRWGGRAAKPLDAAVALLMFFVTLAMAVVPQVIVGDRAMAVATGVAVGGCWAWFLASYFEEYVRLPSRTMATYVLLSFSVFPLLRLPLEFVPLRWALLVSLVVPLSVLPLLRGARRAAADAGRSEPRVQGDAQGLVAIIGELGLYGLVVGVLRVNADSEQASALVTVASLCIKALLPMMLLALVYRDRSQMRVLLLCQLMLAAAVTAVAVAVAVKDAPAVSFAVFDCMRQLLYVLLYFILCILAPRLRIEPVLTFCAGWGLYVTCLAVGMLASVALGGFAGYPDWFVIALLCVLAWGGVFAFNAGNNPTVKLFADGSPEHVPPLSTFARIDACCERIAAERGLTRRELEVMQLICKGRSKRYIAEEFVISENTVRTYAKSLYGKLGVHSRQELLTLVEEVDAGVKSLV